MSEYGKRVITCTNEDGVSISFGEQGFTPFILCSAEGIYDINNTVNTVSNTIMDGAEYQGTVMQARNIILTVKDIDTFDVNREMIDAVFKKGAVGVLNVLDDSHSRSIDYYVESVTVPEATPFSRLTIISLICPDPYFYDPVDFSVGISNLMEDFEFEHEFSASGETFAHFNDDHLGVIENVSADNEIGFTLILVATGNITNPKITKVETQEFIQVGRTGKAFNMSYGDVLTIVTEKGKKNIYYNGTSINQYLTEDSTFFYLTRGNNSLGYAAESGVEYVTIRVMYRYKYMRA